MSGPYVVLSTPEWGEVKESVEVGDAKDGNLLKLGGSDVLNAATPNVDYALPILYVTITQDGQDSDGNPIYKSDKTYDEIKAAHEAGREVYARIKFYKNDFYHFLRISEVNTAASRVTFFSITMSLDGVLPTQPTIPIEYITLYVYSTGTVKCERYEFLVPTQTFLSTLLNVFLSFQPGVEQELNEEQQETGRERLSAAKAVPVTTADNGKFLRVVDGQWAAEAVANAKGVSF